MLVNKGMTEGQFRGQLISERRHKNKQYQARQLIHDCERELQELEHKKVRYKSEFKRKMMILQIEESDYIEMYNFHYDKSLKQPKMRRSLNRKRILLHDTLHSNLKEGNAVLDFETKTSEQYTIDLLRKAEEKDIELQMQFLERVAKKEIESNKPSVKPRKKLQSARPFHFKIRDRKERCLSALMIQQEQSKSQRKSGENLIGFNTMVSQANEWKSFGSFYSTTPKKFVTASELKLTNRSKGL